MKTGAGRSHDAARVASPDDSGVIAQLLHAFNTEFGAASPGPDVLDARLRMLLAWDATFAVVAGDPVQSVGLVTLRPNVWSGTVALLDELYTVPSRRSQGLGAQVLERAIEEAKRRGATEFEIEVDEPDADAQRFYARHGFPLRDPQTGDRAFVLEKALAD